MLEKFIPFVNDQMEFHAGMAKFFIADSPKRNPRRAEKHAESSAKFAELALAIEEALKAPTQVAGGPAKPIQLALSFDEIEGLPSELLQELSFSDSDRTDYTIMRLIEDAGGIASLDRILVGFYKQTGEIMKRTTLNSRAYRMIQKGLLFPVPNKKGAYATHELTDEEAARILGI